MALSVLLQLSCKMSARLTLALHLAAVVASVFREASLVAGARAFEVNGTWLSLVYPELNTEAFYEQNFLPVNGQNPGLPAVIEQLRVDYDGLAEQGKGYMRLLSFWREELLVRKSALQELHDTGRLSIDPEHVLMDFLHLALNRLDLSLAEECYVYNLVAFGIKQHLEGSPVNRT
jgi:hypothetical protein